eukprot:scaffold17951_cov63-Phaeocystis_antarctica.AAC.4
MASTLYGASGVAEVAVLVPRVRRVVEHHGRGAQRRRQRGPRQGDRVGRHAVLPVGGVKAERRRRPHLLRVELRPKGLILALWPLRGGFGRRSGCHRRQQRRRARRRHRGGQLLLLVAAVLVPLLRHVAQHHGRGAQLRQQNRPRHGGRLGGHAVVPLHGIEAERRRRPHLVRMEH